MCIRDRRGAARRGAARRGAARRGRRAGVRRARRRDVRLFWRFVASRLRAGGALLLAHHNRGFGAADRGLCVGMPLDFSKRRVHAREFMPPAGAPVARAAAAAAPAPRARDAAALARDAEAPPRAGEPWEFGAPLPSRDLLEVFVCRKGGS